MRARLLVALAAGLMIGANPAPDLGEAVQVIPPGSHWRRAHDGSVWEFGTDGVLRIRANWPGVLEFPYALDPQATPPRFNRGPEGMPGIYRLEGDRLLLCLGSHARPTTFATRPGQYLLIFKRLK